MKPKTQVLHLRIPEELHRFLRIRAAEKGVSVNTLVAEWLDKHHASKRKEWTK